MQSVGKKPVLINDIWKETVDFMSEIGIDNYSIEDNGSLTIPIGWKGRYITPKRALTPNEQVIIDYIDIWG